MNWLIGSLTRKFWLRCTASKHTCGLVHFCRLPRFHAGPHECEAHDHGCRAFEEATP